MDSVVHFEIPADKLKRAKGFYSKVFGWKVNEFPQMKYVLLHTSETDKKGMLKKPGAINGGMLERQSPVKVPVITINVKSIEASSKKIEKAGGKVIRGKIPIGEMGYAAYFKDSEGNVVGLWENA